MEDNRPNKLYIETDSKAGTSKIKVAGTIEDLFFNLLVLTAQVCDETGITPEEWAAMLPNAVKTYKRVILTGKVAIDFSRFRKGGGTP